MTYHLLAGADAEQPEEPKSDKALLVFLGASVAAIIGAAFYLERRERRTAKWQWLEHYRGST